MTYKHKEGEIYATGKEILKMYDQTLIDNLNEIRVYVYLYHDYDGVIYVYIVTFKKVHTQNGVEWGNYGITNSTSA